MLSNEDQLEKKKNGITKILKIITKLPAEFIYYLSSILAIASLGGSEFPQPLVTIGMTLGINSLSTILDRIVNENNISDEEIRKIIEQVVDSLDASDLIKKPDLDKAFSEMFKRFEIEDYIHRQNEEQILEVLKNHFADLREIKMGIDELKTSIKGLHIELSNKFEKISKNSSQKFIDEKVIESIEFLRKSRFFAEFDKVNYSISLANNLISGEYCGCSTNLKSKALAWCSRVLSSTQEIEKSRKYLEIALENEKNEETDICQAFAFSQDGDKSSALKILSKFNSPESKSASLMIVINHEGILGGVDWLKSTQINIDQLDSDGKYFLLSHYLISSMWEEASKEINNVYEVDFQNTPILFFSKTLILLIYSIPNQLRPYILSQIPLNSRDFPLSSFPKDTESRREAYQYFKIASSESKKLGFPKFALLCDDYALWIKLRDHENYLSAIRELERKLSGPELWLHYVHLGFQFGIKLDIKKIEMEINRQTALHGEATPESAIARLAITLQQGSLTQVANYFEVHKHEFERFFDKNFIHSAEIDFLVKAGMVNEAKEKLDSLTKFGDISKETEKFLAGIISEAQGSDPIEIRKHIFTEFGLLDDLWLLVYDLLKFERWEDLCEYSRGLFEKIHDLKSAEIYAKALQESNKLGILLDFLRNNYEITRQSKNLMFLLCWTLYQHGFIQEAIKELSNIPEDFNDSRYRQLRITLATAVGDLNNLVEIISNEYSQNKNRNAQELLEAAQIGLQIEFPDSKDLIYLAAERGKEDASILFNCYLLASKAGFENEKSVIEWLTKAALLSGEDGPMQKKSIKEIVDEFPKWHQYEANIINKLQNIELPLFLAAQTLNKSIINLISFNASQNFKELDSRKITSIPCFSGKRKLKVFDLANTIGFDVSTLLVLGHLGILETTFTSINSIVLPHSTLEWFFEETQKITFHQQKLFERAHKIIEFKSVEKLSVLNPTNTPNSDLANQIGNELAILIAEARSQEKNDSFQKLVVRSSPIHLASSLLDNEAEMGSYYDILCSCQAIIDKMYEIGQIDTEERNKANSYLHFVETPWPNQPEVSTGAWLYLDSLSVSYLYEIGMLERLSVAGFKVIISQEEFLDCQNFINYEGFTKQVLFNIDEVRKVINKEIKSGKIKIGKSQSTIENRRESILNHPSANLFTLVNECDGIVIDDRFFNQNENIQFQNENVPIFTTLDIIDSLFDKQIIDLDKKNEIYKTLRKSGFMLIPVEKEEILNNLLNSKIIENKIFEKAELRAIKENFLQIKMGSWLNFSNEFPWISSSLVSFIDTLIEIWNSDENVQKLKIKSDWLLELIDIRGWSQFFHKDTNYYVINDIHGGNILSIILKSIQNLNHNHSFFNNWIEIRILSPLKNHNPENYMGIVNQLKNKIIDISRINVPDQYKENKDPLEIRKLIVKILLKNIPSLIYQSLLDDKNFCEEFQIRSERTIFFQSDKFGFIQSEFYKFLKEIISGKPLNEIVDLNRNSWWISQGTSDDGFPIINLYYDPYHINIYYAALLSSDPDVRNQFIQRNTSDVYISNKKISDWKEINSIRQFNDDELSLFVEELENTPTYIEKAIKTEVDSEYITINTLIPSSIEYYEKLIGSYNGSLSIQEYANTIGKEKINSICEKDPYSGFLYSLYLSGHSAVTNVIPLDGLDNEKILTAFEYILEYGDRLSQIGAIEIGFRNLNRIHDVEPILLRLIQNIFNENVSELSNGFQLFSSLFIFVDGELSRIKFFNESPPFFRRFASLSQAALIHRQIINSNLDQNYFNQWLLKTNGEQFFIQSLVDMRLEPRWIPDYAEPTQMKADFIGRINAVVNKYNDFIKSKELKELIDKINQNYLGSPQDYLRTFFPGPLEGNFQNKVDVPIIFEKMIEEQLNKEEVSPTSFFALLNLARIFTIKSEHVNLAAKLLKQSHYYLSNIEERDQLIDVLNGLSSVAAINRNIELSSELRILTRRFRNDIQFDVSVDESIRICLISAASHENIDEWRKFIGEWLTELAFNNLKDDEGIIFQNVLELLFQIDPYLWFTCGKAEAALSAYNNAKIQ